jgi:glycerone phosphate O-acyltransferase
MIFTVLPFMKPSHGLYRILHNIIVNISLFFFKGYCRAFGDSSRDLKKINRLKPFMDLPILFVHYTQSSFYFESELTAISDLNGERYMFSCVLAAEKFVLSYRNKPCDPNIHHAQPVIVPKKPQILTDLLWALTQPRGNLAIRFAAFSIRQILSMTETDLTIDVDSFARLSQAVEEVNVQSKESITIVLAPTHRSLFDFLILSYVFFSLPEIQVDLPFIAAAEEFSTLPILGWLAQCCGAFFIKRGLGSVDKNLDQQIVNLKRKHNKSKRPFFVEVFVEGKRSRDRVFLKPKTGILK